MNTAEDFRKYCDDNFFCEPDPSSYQERFGNADELTSVIGMVVIEFANLENKLRDIITQMLQLDEEQGDIVTCELSFKQKVNLFSSLYNQLNTKYYFNTFPGFEKEYIKELIKWMNRTEEQRNRIMHSTITGTKNGVRIRKTTAKQNGLLRQEEELTIPEIITVSDKIVVLIMELDQFQINIMDPLP